MFNIWVNLQILIKAFKLDRSIAFSFAVFFSLDFAIFLIIFKVGLYFVSTPEIKDFIETWYVSVGFIYSFIAALNTTKEIGLNLIKFEDERNGKI